MIGGILRDEMVNLLSSIKRYHNMIGGILRDEMVNLLGSIKRLTEFAYFTKNSWQQDIEETQYGQG